MGGNKKIDVQSLRATLARRLVDIAKRYGMSREDIARSSRLPVSVVEGYFRGKREIYFPELSSICQTLGTDVLWITSKNYQSSRLAYRGVSEAAKKSAEGIEHAISLVLDLFQKSSRPRVEPIGESIDDAKLLLMEVDKRAGEFRERFHTIQSLFECHQTLPAMESEAKAGSPQ